MEDNTAQRPESRYGWFMVAVAAAFTGLGTGSMGAFAVYLKPLTSEFGWLRGETSFAYLAASIAMGAGGMLMGWAADRYSTRPVVLMGTLVLGLVCLLLSTQQQLWQLYLYYVLLGGLGSSAFDAPLLANIGGWFERNKGLAIGLTTAGRALGQGLLPFAVGVMIPLHGWRTAYVAMAVLALGVMLPLSFLVRNAPKAPALPVKAPQSGAAPREAEPPGWFVPWIAFAAVFCCVCMATAMMHVAALAQDKGLSPGIAAGVLLCIFVTGFFGRIAFGRLADQIGGLRAYVVASAIQTALVFWFTQAQTPVQFYLVATLFGFGFSGVMTCVVVSVREYAPPSRAGSAQGTVLFLAWIGMGLGGWQAGYLYDLTGSYLVPFAVAALTGVVNLVILGAIYARLHRLQLLPQLRWGLA